MGQDFSKTFASTGTLEPLTDAQYNQGWECLGATPPSFGNFNWMFQQQDKKFQELKVSSGIGRWNQSYYYTIGQTCYDSTIGSFKFAVVTQAGTSGTTEPIWGNVGTSVTDGGVIWKIYDFRQNSGIGSCVGTVDNGSGLAALPAISGKNLTEIGSLITDQRISTATTSISLSGLAGKSAKGYVLEVYLKNTSTSPTIYSMFINGDTTNSNYWCQNYLSVGTSLTSIQNPSAAIYSCPAGGNIWGIINVSVSPDGIVTYSGFIQRTSDDSNTNQSLRYKNTVSDLTNITISSSVTSAIGVDSNIRLWRRY